MRILIPFLLFAFLLVSAPSAAPDSLTSAEALELVAKKPENLIILDVRTPPEFADGHIANAKNIDFFGSRFESEIEKLPKDAEILVYCQSGRRSEAATELLRDAGYAGAINLTGGIKDWIKAGGKTIREEAK